MKPTIITFLFFCLGTFRIQAQQENFEVTSSGLTDYIVVQVDSLKSSYCYEKCIEWIGKTYKNPESVIKSKIEGTSIRIEGVEDGLIHTNGGVRYLTRYNLEFTFKDGRYKFDVLSIETYANAQYGWNSFPFKGDWAAYYKDGEPKKAWQCINDIPVYFNNLNADLKKYIKGQSQDQLEKW